MPADISLAPPAKLRKLVSWQAGRVGLLGTRLTAAEMTLEARADYAVLASLLEYGPLTQADLSRALGLDRKNLHGIVHRLDAAGFVRRQTDQDDRRTMVVTISATGTAHFADLDERARRVQRQLLAPLTSDEQGQLVRLLDKVLSGGPADLPA